MGRAKNTNSRAKFYRVFFKLGGQEIHARTAATESLPRSRTLAIGLAKDLNAYGLPAYIEERTVTVRDFLPPKGKRRRKACRTTR